MGKQNKMVTVGVSGFPRELWGGVQSLNSCLFPLEREVLTEV